MPKSNTIPAEYRDLLEGPIVVSLATVNPDGQPQVTPVWCNLIGDMVLVNSAAGRLKVANMLARPKVTVLAIDPADPYRWLEVRGEVVTVIEDQEQAVADINSLSALYRNEPDYYMGNPAMRGKEQRISFHIQPTHVIGRG